MICITATVVGVVRISSIPLMVDTDGRTESYGKATQIFDTIFGTRATREDCTGKY